MTNPEQYRTLAIWTEIGGELSLRAGDVVFDVDSVPTWSDYEGPLFVGSGLQVSDVAIFIGYPSRRRRLKSIGYLVTEVDSEGGGIMVAGDRVELAPRDWVNQHIIDRWQALEGSETPGVFSLPNLEAYLAHLPPGSQNGDIHIA